MWARHQRLLDPISGIGGYGGGLPDEDRLQDWYQALLLSYECLLEYGYLVSPRLSEDAWVESEGTL